jgi:hypothetical protein
LLLSVVVIVVLVPCPFLLQLLFVTTIIDWCHGQKLLFLLWCRIYFLSLGTVATVTHHFSLCYCGIMLPPKEGEKGGATKAETEQLW